jgi:hypothetical protein
MNIQRNQMYGILVYFSWQDNRLTLFNQKSTKQLMLYSVF